jgi:large conductance mechanosensitive channel
MGAIDEFKTFIMKGNVVDMAVGIVIGLAFSAVVTAMVADLITPLIGVPGHLNFAGWSFTLNGSTFQQGLFINAVISFLLIALVVFFLIVKPMNAMNARAAARKPKAAPTTKDCPYCLSEIPIKARKCKFCASDVPADTATDSKKP